MNFLQSMSPSMASIKPNLLLAIILAAVFFLSVVEAGHFKLEPGHSIGNVKYIHINPYTTPSRKWPQRTVKYCYENNDAERKLTPWLRDAMQLWYTQGLPDDYTFEKVPDEPCKGNDRVSSLVVSLSTAEDAEMASSVGLFPNPGMKLYLDPDGHADVNDQLATIAHEIGHVWGLFHEHQDPHYYDNPQGPIIFECRHLHDFDHVTHGMSENEIWGLQGVCKDLYAASSIGFTAAEFVPLPILQTYSIRPWFSKDEDVDWKSIMLYHGFNFAEYAESPVLVRRLTGQPTPHNLVPSQQDIDSLMHLYHDRLSPDPHDPLMYYQASPWHSHFRSKLPGCGHR